MCRGEKLKELVENVFLETRYRIINTKRQKWEEKKKIKYENSKRKREKKSLHYVLVRIW